MKKSYLILLFLLVNTILCAAGVLDLKAEDSILASEARSVAEKYWEAQRTSDQGLFSMVTLYESMDVVFEWTIVRQSEVKVEEGEIEGFRPNFLKIISSNQKMKEIQLKSLENVTNDEMDAMYENFNNLLKEVEIQSHEIGIKHPFLSEFINYGYLNTMIPENCTESKTYKLMGCECIVDVELQSQAGTTLKKKVTTRLRRLIIDNHDSGWKAF